MDICIKYYFGQNFPDHPRTVHLITDANVYLSYVLKLYPKYNDMINIDVGYQVICNHEAY